MTWKLWLHGLSAAALGGLVGAIVQIGSDPSHLNLSDWRHYAGAIVAGSITGVVAYLRQSPLPPKWDGADRRTQPAPPPASTAAAGGKP